MSFLSSILLLVLFCRNFSVSYAYSSPRTFRPTLSGSPSSFALGQIKANQTGRVSDMVYQNSSKPHSSGANILPKMTTQMNYSSVERQHASDQISTPRWLLEKEKICGSRTQNLGYDTNTIDSYFLDFSQYCALWNSSCPGNKSVAKSKHYTQFLLLYTLWAFSQIMSYKQKHF